MEKSLSIYQPILSLFLDPEGSSYIGDRKAVSLIYQKNEKLLHKYLEAVIKQKKNCAAIQKSFSRPATKYKITPLHVAAMTGQLKTAEKLLRIMKVNPNHSDHQGWTPLHHATLLEDDDMVALLKKFKASEKLKNDQGATPDELHDLLHPKPLREKIYQVTDAGDFEEITPDQFQVITGAEYINQMVVTSHVLAVHWANETCETHPHSCQKDFRSQYLDPSRAADSLALQIAGHDENDRPIPIGSSVVARRAIKKGELITEYLGVLNPTDKITHGDDNYILNHINGREARNLGPMIPDGYPNALMLSVSNLKGLFNRYLLIAGRDISQGTPVAWDYGQSSVKTAKFGITKEERCSLTNRYVEVFPDTTEAALHGNQLLKLIKKVTDEAAEESIDQLHRNSIFSYILNTPVVFLKHVLNGNIHPETIRILLTTIKPDSPFNLFKNPLPFQIEALIALMETPEQYCFVRYFLLAFLDQGYLYFTASILISLYESRLSRFKDIEGFQPEDFKNFKEAILELLEDEKPIIAFNAALHLFTYMSPKGLSNSLAMPKLMLKNSFEMEESKNPSKHEIVIDK